MKVSDIITLNNENPSFMPFLKFNNLSYMQALCVYCKVLLRLDYLVITFLINNMIQYSRNAVPAALTHWGPDTHICDNKLTSVGSDNGLSPGRRQAIIWTNVGILLIGPLRTKFSDNLVVIHTFSSKKMHLKMSSGKWRPFRLGLNVLTFRPPRRAIMQPSPNKDKNLYSSYYCRQWMFLSKVDSNWYSLVNGVFAIFALN